MKKSIRHCAVIADPTERPFKQSVLCGTLVARGMRAETNIKRHDNQKRPSAGVGVSWCSMRNTDISNKKFKKKLASAILSIKENSP